MDIESELAVLQAESIAVQAVLIAVLRRLGRERPELGPLVCGAFEDAESLMSGLTLNFGGHVPIANTVGALRVLEEIRTAVIADENMCGRDP